MNKHQGFTLIEMMIVVIVVSILTAIAFPAYQSFVRKSTEGLAQQEILKLTRDLEQYKSRQFNYLGFTPNTVYLPTGADASTAQYVVEIVDGDETGKKLDATRSAPKGRHWAIRAKATDGRLYSYLVDSKGLKCKNKTAANVTMTACGTGKEEWK